MKLALIGNCSYQALIDDRARVRWLCWPRFDASFVFGSLLDDGGGELSIGPAGEGFETEQSYVGLTNVLRTVFRSGDEAFEVIDFAPRFRQYERSFKPTMLMRIIRPISGGPLVRVRCRPTYDYGRRQLRSFIGSNHIQWELPEASLRLTSNVPQAYIAEERSFLLEHDTYVVLTWGEPLEAALEETCESFLDRTLRYWERWVKRASIPGRFQREVLRSALALKLQQYEQTGAITAAATTSLPEYHGAGRNWDYRYCWLRDAYFTLNAMRRLNQFEETEAFVSYLANIAMRAEGARLQPVYGITGEEQLDETVLEHLAGYGGDGPVRIGNAAFAQVQNDVYGEMIAAIAPMFLDIRFSHLYSAHHERVVAVLLRRIEQTMEEPDAGLWEIRDEPKLHTFSLLMHWLGAEVASHIAAVAGNEAMRTRARTASARAKHIIETRCWRRDLDYYADATTSDHADAAMLMMVNLGFLPPDSPHAHDHVDALRRRLSVRDSLLHRYVHDDGIGETHAAFTVCGFWYAEALARLGRHEQAAECLESLVSLANHVGLFSEDVDPQTGDLLGNFPQTYSHVGLINAAFALAPQPEGLV